MKSVKYLLFVICVSILVDSTASHLRAGEITSKQISNLTCEFTLTLYISKDFGAIDTDLSFQNITIDGQDIIVSLTDSILIGSVNFRTLRCDYKFTYTFQSSSTTHTVAYTEINRVEGIKNIQGLNNASSQVPLHISHTLLLSNTLNSSPVPQINPIDIGTINQPFTHGFACWDEQGDSLSYKLVVPQQELNEEVPVYISPDDSRYGEGSTLSLDEKSGLITWDSPKQAGLYTIAIEVSEWGVSSVGAYLKSKFIRDMQIKILESDNKSPEILMPSDKVLEADQSLKHQYYVEDETDFVDLVYSTFSGIFNLGASISKVNTDSNYYELEFFPACNQTRESPYYSFLKSLMTIRFPCLQ